MSTYIYVYVLVRTHCMIYDMNISLLSCYPIIDFDLKPLKEATMIRRSFSMQSKFMIFDKTMS